MYIRQLTIDNENVHFVSLSKLKKKLLTFLKNYFLTRVLSQVMRKLQKCVKLAI